MREATVGTGLSGRRQKWLLVELVLIMGPKALLRLFVMMRALADRGHGFYDIIIFIWECIMMKMKKILSSFTLIN